jgi:hypothetical protein
MSDNYFSKLMSGGLEGNRALLILLSDDDCVPLGGDLEDKVRTSRSVFLVETSLTRREDFAYLRRQDFDIVLTPNSPELKPNAQMYWMSNYEDQKQWLTYGEKAKIVFIPKTEEGRRVSSPEIQINISVKRDRGQYGQHININPGTHYKIHALNYVNSTWDEIEWGVLPAEDSTRRYYDPEEGIQIEIEFELEAIDKNRGYQNQYNYVYKDAFVFVVDSIDIRVNEKGVSMKETKESSDQ